MTPFRNPLVVAMDIDSGVRALKLTREMGDRLGGVKIGPRLALKEGAPFLQQLAEIAPVFLDCKFYDIPSTMEHSIRTAHEAGVSLVTIHGLSGLQIMRQMRQLEAELNGQRPFRIAAVSLLTSYDDDNLPSLIRHRSTKEGVFEIISEVQESGLSTIVCSAAEVAEVRKKFPNLDCICPGIRLPENDSGDQKRVVGPQEALQSGASALGVGRPIVAADNPVQAFNQFFEISNGAK